MGVATLLLVLATQPAWAAPVVLRHEVGDAIITLTVDDSRIDPATVGRYLALHPRGYDPRYRLAPSLRLCIEGNPRYRPCGARDPNAEHFFENARVNLRLAAERLQEINRLPPVETLRPLVDYFRSSLRFSTWLETRLFEYLQSGNLQQLNQSYESLPAPPDLDEILTEIAGASPFERWRIAFYRWRNAMNHVYREREPEIPRAAWDEFLTEYGITESVDDSAAI